MMFNCWDVENIYTVWTEPVHCVFEFNCLESQSGSLKVPDMTINWIAPMMLKM